MTKATILSVTNPTERGDKKQLGNLPGAALPLAIAELAKQHSSHSLLVVPDPQIALKLQAEIEQFTDQPVSLFLIGKRCHTTIFLHTKRSFLTVLLAYTNCRINVAVSLSCQSALFFSANLREIFCYSTH